MMEPAYYLTLSSPFGPFALVWRETEGSARIYRVFLSREQPSAKDWVHGAFAGSKELANPIVAAFGERIQRLLEGEDIGFQLDQEPVALETCSEFQRRVLRAEHAIPRGYVSTYGRIGAHLGLAQGGRSVGSALARNPFPLVIPCHRAIRADGTLGGYQGGRAMKRALLEMEGVEVSASDRVRTPRVFY